MSTIKNMKTLSLAGGTALVLGMASGSVLAADSNPFAMTSLSDGYEVAVNEGKCGEGKCGGDKAAGKAKDAEGKCGGEAKEAEGKCGGNKAEGKPKVQEAKCGEGKCGGAS
ncbi:MAG: hypothetical protein RQ936_05300 [Gammaproteobacteria bacterium]|nr:hypothetical protein [Gammaproteobacteria bacterium]